MAIGVIYFLKPVQVNVHQADCPAAPVVVYVLIKTSAVVKSCKKIRIRAVPDLFLKITLHCHIPENAKLAGHMIKYVIDGVFVNLQHLTCPVLPGYPRFHVSFAVDGALFLKGPGYPHIIIPAYYSFSWKLKILLKFPVGIEYLPVVIP